MIHAKIRCNNTLLLTEMWTEPESLQEQIIQIGVALALDEIPLKDSEVQIELLASGEEYCRLKKLFRDTDTLHTVNRAVRTLFFAQKLHESLQVDAFETVDQFIQMARGISL